MKCDLLRQKLSADLVERLREAINSFELAQGGLNGKATVGRPLLEAVPGSPEYNSAFDLISWFWDSGLDGEFEARYGNPPVLLTPFCTIRRHLATERTTHVDWHLDANFVGFGGDFAVFWVPVDPVGKDRPGLDFYIPKGQYQLSEVSQRWNSLPIVDGGRTLDDAGIETFFGSVPARRASPELNPGDVLLFNELVPHRTQRMEAITRDRTAIEFRVTSRQRPVPRHPVFGARLVATKAPGEGIRLTPANELFAS